MDMEGSMKVIVAKTTLGYGTATVDGMVFATAMPRANKVWITAMGETPWIRGGGWQFRLA